MKSSTYSASFRHRLNQEQENAILAVPQVLINQSSQRAGAPQKQSKTLPK